MEEVINDKQAKSRARAKKYYDANKDKINQQRRDSYLAKLNKPDVQIINPVEDDEGDETPLSNTNSSNDILLQRLDALELNPNTLKKYKYDLKKVFTLINNEPLIPHLRNGQSLVTLIKNCELSTNTKRGLIQICLFIITKYGLTINKKAVKIMTDYFTELKLQNDEAVSKKTTTEEVISWKEYLDKVKEHFGEKSKMWAIVKLYNEITLRDDFVLKIVAKKPKTTNENYLVLNKNNYTLIVNNYKTKDKYGVINQKLTKGLTGILREYIASNELKEGDYLFGNKELSAYIIRENQKIGLKIGISAMRHMTVSESMSLPLSSRIALASKMRHNVITQMDYVRVVN